MAQMTVPTLATWCAVYTVADQSSEPELSYVLHEDEDRIDGLKTLLMKVDAPEPVPTPGARVWTAPSDAAHDAALRTSMRSLGLGNSARPSTGPGATLATASAVGGETVVLPLVARNRVIGMLTLGKPTEEHFRQEILELAEDLSRRAALALDNARLYSERTADSRSLQRSLLPPGAARGPRPGGRGHLPRGRRGQRGRRRLLRPLPDPRRRVRLRDRRRLRHRPGSRRGHRPRPARPAAARPRGLRRPGRPGAAQRRPSSTRAPAAASYAPLRRALAAGRRQRPPQGRLRGHPLPLRLRQDGTVEPAAEPQPLLGVMDDLELYEQTVTLDPGDVLLCVTDGVTERREGTRMLGDDGLTDVLTTCTGLTAGAVAARVRAPWNASPRNRPPTTWPSSPCALSRARRFLRRGAGGAREPRRNSRT